MKKFLIVTFSVILSILIICFELTLGILFCFQNSMQVNSISSAIQNVDFTTLMYDENGQITDFGEAINDMFEEMGFSIEESNELLNTPTLKKVLGDFTSSVIMASVDESVEIIYPQKEDLKNIVDECYDIVNKKQNIDVSKKEIMDTIDSEYDDLVKNLKELSDELNESLNLDDSSSNSRNANERMNSYGE